MLEDEIKGLTEFYVILKKNGLQQIFRGNLLQAGFLMQLQYIFTIFFRFSGSWIIFV